jgi:molybdenum cofactor cytidylyltransferase
MTEDPAILILAAGRSRRMRGADKLLEPVDGTPQLRRIAIAAISSGARVWVALPPDRPGRTTALTGLRLKQIAVADGEDGISASLRAGNAAVPDGSALMVLLADLPEITTADLQTMMKTHGAAPGMILRATSAAGQPGHPVLFPAWSRRALQDLTGDNGARDVLQRYQSHVQNVALPDDHAVTDLDTPEDWARWRAARGLQS